MKTKTKKIIMGITSITGISIALITLKAWSAYGSLTLFSYLVASFMYVLAPLVLAYGLLFDKNVNNPMSKI